MKTASMIVRDGALAWQLSFKAGTLAAVMIGLAGCAIEQGGPAAAMQSKTTTTTTATATATTTNASTAAAPKTVVGMKLDLPPAYAVIDGQKAPVPAIVMGDPATVQRIIDEGVNRNKVMDHITYISNEIGPRLTGSSNAETANKWARDNFEKWGLSIPPFGGAEGQTSTDPSVRGLWQWGQIAVRFDRGPSTGKVLSLRNPGSDTPDYRTVREMEFTSPAWTAGTNGPVRGPVIKIPDSDEAFEAVKGKIKGSWILVKPNAAGRRGIGGGAGGRLAALADIRKKWKGGDEAAAKAAEADEDVTHYEGTVTGGALPEPMPFTLDVKLTDPKAVTGTVSLGGFRKSEITEATLNADTQELKFKTESPRGAREYTLKIDGDAISGKTTVPPTGEGNGGGAGGEMVYTGKKVTAEAPAKGPGLDEKILALQPAGWIIASGNELVITGGIGGWRELNIDNVTPDVVVTVRKSDYDTMNSSLADGSPIEAEFDLKSTLTKGPIPVYDTIAEIRGTELPDEVIIVSGHLDSWDGPGSKGTTDNGTGSAVTLEAARLLAVAGAKPKRTIRFILWTGEEQGLLGSVAYVKYLKDRGELEKVSAVLVDDGGTNYEGGLSCVASQVEYLAAATAPVNGHFYSEKDQKMLDVNVHAEKVFSQVQGSDHNSFMREKIPGFFWDEIGRADYNHTHHTQHDNLDQAIPEYLRQSATCAAVTAYNLACAPAMLSRPTDAEWPARGGGNRQRTGPAGGAPSAPGAPGTVGTQPSGSSPDAPRQPAGGGQ